MRPHPTPIRRQAALGSQGLAYFFIHGPGILHAQPNFFTMGLEGYGGSRVKCVFSVASLSSQWVDHAPLVDMCMMFSWPTPESEIFTLETKVWDVTGGGISESGSLGNIAHAREVK